MAWSAPPWAWMARGIVGGGVDGVLGSELSGQAVQLLNGRCVPSVLHPANLAGERLHPLAR